MMAVRLPVMKRMALISAVIIRRPGGLENTNLRLIQPERVERAIQRQRDRRKNSLPSMSPILWPVTLNAVKYKQECNVV